MKKKSLFAALLALILVVVLLAACSAQKSVSRSGENTKIYFTQGGDALVFSSGATLTVNSGATVSNAGTQTVSGSLIYGQSSFTPTAGQTLTPAAAFYEVNSSGAISMTLGTTGITSGQVVYLYGDDNNTVTVNDTNIRSTDGNAVTFGQYDIVGFIFDGADWIHMFKSANQ